MIRLGGKQRRKLNCRRQSINSLPTPGGVTHKEKHSTYAKTVYYTKIERAHIRKNKLGPKTQYNILTQRVTFSYYNYGQNGPVDRKNNTSTVGAQSFRVLERHFLGGTSASCPMPLHLYSRRQAASGWSCQLHLQLQPPLYLQLALSTRSALPNCVPVDDTGEG